MDKILVEVFVPITEKKYDIFIPSTIKISELIYLIGSALSNISQGLFIMNRETILCFKENGVILDINLSIYESCLHNGSQLILI